jgi:hypothetical protein
MLGIRRVSDCGTAASTIDCGVPELRQMMLAFGLIVGDDIGDAGTPPPPLPPPGGTRPPTPPELPPPPQAAKIHIPRTDKPAVRRAVSFTVPPLPFYEC